MEKRGGHKALHDLVRENWRGQELSNYGHFYSSPSRTSRAYESPPGVTNHTLEICNTEGCSG